MIAQGSFIPIPTSVSTHLEILTETAPRRLPLTETIICHSDLDSESIGYQTPDHIELQYFENAAQPIAHFFVASSGFITQKSGTPGYVSSLIYESVLCSL